MRYFYFDLEQNLYKSTDIKAYDVSLLNFIQLFFKYTLSLFRNILIQYDS